MIKIIAQAVLLASLFIAIVLWASAVQLLLK